VSNRWGRRLRQLKRESFEETPEQFKTWHPIRHTHMSDLFPTFRFREGGFAGDEDGDTWYIMRCSSGDCGGFEEAVGVNGAGLAWPDETSLSRASWA
jgi:hypothetical protein